jgi:hemolysin activation/secretion protein
LIHYYYFTFVNSMKFKCDLVYYLIGCSFSLTLLNSALAPSAMAQINLPREPRPPSIAPPPEITPPVLPPPAELLPPPSQLSPGIEIVPGNVATTLQVKQFNVVGSTVFSAQDFAKITQPYTDRTISLAELFEVRTRITNLYLERGYITSGAYIPAQKLENGIVTIQILEGRLAAVNVTGTRRLNPGYVRSRIGIATQPPLNRDRLLEALQLLQLNPLIKNVSAELSAGNRAGENILDLKVAETPIFDAQIVIDNARSPSAGTDRRKIQLTNANLLGLGDGLSVGYTNTRGSNAIDLTYSLPINPRNGTLSFSYGSSSSRVVEQPFDVLNIRSNSQFYEITVRQPIIQTPTTEFAIGITASRQDSAASLLSGTDEKIPFPSVGSDDSGGTHVTALRVFQEYRQRSRQSALALRSQFSLGLNVLNATINEQAPDGRFLSWRGQAQYVQLLAPETLLLLRGSVQLADRQLLPFEQFSLGGQDTVRGYRQDLLFTDNALFASIEARIPVLRLPKLNALAQISPFVDFGYGKNRGNSADPDPNTLASVGLGLRLQVSDRFNARLDWGIPLTSVSGNKRTSQENGLYFAIVYNTSF